LELRNPKPAAAPAQARLLWPMLLLVAAYCGWILSLPLFPMQDGPVHLYLAQVLGDVVAHKPSVYAGFYSVPRLLTPYCLQYYLLIALTKFVSALSAEKLFVALIVVLECFGFRYLCMGIGPSGALYSLLIVGTVLNWPLMMGFQSYALAVALSCWALGLWLRLRRATPHPWAYAAGFLACTCLVLLTHPLPYLIVLAVCSLDLLIMRGTPHVSASGWKHQVIAFVIACLPLLFLWSFARTHRTTVAVSRTWSTERLRYFVGLHGLSFFGGSALPVRLYQAAMVFIFLLGIVVAVRSLRRAGPLALFSNSSQSRSSAPFRSPTHIWLLATLLLGVLLLVLPDGFGGSRAVVLRLEPTLWIGALAAASGAPWPRRSIATALVALGVVSALLPLTIAAARITPLARRIASIHADPISDASGRRGLILTTRPEAEADFNSLLYVPYYWEGVSYFRRTHSVLLNTPWMDSTWLPVQPRHRTPAATGLLIQYDHPPIDPDAIEFYWKLRSLMLQSPSLRQRILSQTDFVLFTDQDRTATQLDLDAVLEPSQYSWSCQRHDWYVLCDKNQGAKP
jgi:hypothetical protein